MIDPDGRDVVYSNKKDKKFYENAAERNWRVRKTLSAFKPGSGRDLFINRGTPKQHPQGFRTQAVAEISIRHDPDTQEMIDAYNAAGGGEAGDAAALKVPPVPVDVESATITLGSGSSGHAQLHELAHVNQALENPSDYLDQANEANQATTVEEYRETPAERYADEYAEAAGKKERDPLEE